MGDVQNICKRRQATNRSKEEHRERRNGVGSVEDGMHDADLGLQLLQAKYKMEDTHSYIPSH